MSSKPISNFGTVTHNVSYVRIAGPESEFPLTLMASKDNTTTDGLDMDKLDIDISEFPQGCPALNPMGVGTLAGMGLFIILAIVFMILYFKTRSKLRRFTYNYDY